MQRFKANQVHRPSRSLACSSSFAFILIGCCVIGGCQRTALRPDDRRSQFDRYDQSRNQRVQPHLEDEFGQRTPNLAGRLIDPED